jgi:hypothetical protein
MHQREAARAAWAAAGLTTSRDEGLRRFMATFDALPNDCWPQVIALVREEYPQYLERLATPLWNSGDPLLRVNLLRYADPSRQDEAEWVDRITARLDPERDGYELSAAVEHASAKLQDRILRRKKPPDAIRLRAHQRRTEIGDP